MNRSVALNESYIDIDKDRNFEHHPPKIEREEEEEEEEEEKKQREKHC